MDTSVRPFLCSTICSLSSLGVPSTRILHRQSTEASKRTLTFTTQPFALTAVIKRDKRAAQPGCLNFEAEFLSERGRMTLSLCASLSFSFHLWDLAKSEKSLSFHSCMSCTTWAQRDLAWQNEILYIWKREKLIRLLLVCSHYRRVKVFYSWAHSPAGCRALTVKRDSLGFCKADILAAASLTKNIYNKLDVT